MLRPTALSILAFALASCGAGTGSEIGTLVVTIEPALDGTGALHVGHNPRAPLPEVDALVSAERPPDGSMVVDVRVTKAEMWFVSRFVLRSETGGVQCQVTSHFAQGDSTHYRWPSRDTRGSVTLNRADFRDLTGKPLVLHTDVTGWRSGSDVSEKLRIEITKSDLR